MKKYFFVLGSNEKLSLAELSAIFPNNKWQKLDSIVISDFSSELEIESLMSSLGGIIKIGEIIKELSLANRHSLSESVKKELVQSARREELSGKFNFGFSFYNKKNLSGDFFKLGLAVKKDLKNMGISSRMVMSREDILSSVVVEQNKLIKNGLELCFMLDKSKVFLGKTLTVQPFKDLSERDFGRPNRDDHSGMIPPKLAQVMINLARRDDRDCDKKTLLDPFCGSGTILMEAYLMGFKNIIGSDLSERAVSGTIKNIDWLIDYFENNKSKNNQKNSSKIDKKNIFNIFQSDVLDLAEKIEKNSIDYIVCEPYLGPQRGYKKFDEVVMELNELYSKSLEILFDILKLGGRLVMVWPQFRAEGNTWKLDPSIGKFKFYSMLGGGAEGGIKNRSNEKDKTSSICMSIVYGRPEQKVWREILVLEKN